MERLAAEDDGDHSLLAYRCHDFPSVSWAGGDLPDSLQVRFGDGVTAETRWYVEEALQQAWTTFAPYLMDPHGLEALVVVVTNPDAAAAVWAEERGISEDRARRQFTARSSHFAGLATSGLAVIVTRPLENLPPGLTCDDLAADGGYSGVIEYFLAYGQPAELDPDGDGYPCSPGWPYPDRVQYFKAGSPGCCAG